MANQLAQKACVPCKGGVPSLAQDRVNELLQQVPGWGLNAAEHLERAYEFPDFSEALAFVNRVGAMAEGQGHHPDLFLAWGKVRVEIWTHKINGLTESDFIFAAKVDTL